MFFIIILLTFFGVLVPKIVNQVFLDRKASNRNPALEKLREEIRNERENVAGISAVSEFARFARAQRKLRSLEQDLVQKLKETVEPIEQDRTRIIKWTQVGLGLALTYIGITGFSSPVLILPQEWLYPFGWLLSTTTGIPGAISTTMWILICRTVSQIVISKT